MGLDMYLMAQKYESRSTWRFEEGHYKEIGEGINQIVKEFYPEDLQKIGLKHIKDNFLSKQTRYQIGYWRKFNALQTFFQNRVESDYELCHGIYVHEDTIHKPLYNVDISQLLGIKRYNRRKIKGRGGGRLCIVIVK